MRYSRINLHFWPPTSYGCGMYSYVSTYCTSALSFSVKKLSETTPLFVPQVPPSLHFKVQQLRNNCSWLNCPGLGRLALQLVSTSDTLPCPAGRQESARGCSIPGSSTDPPIITRVCKSMNLGDHQSSHDTLMGQIIRGEARRDSGADIAFVLRHQFHTNVVTRQSSSHRSMSKDVRTLKRTLFFASDSL